MLRRSRRLRQNEVAASAGLDPSYVASLEAGRRKPPREDIMERLLCALQATPDERDEMKRLAALDQGLRNLRRGLDNNFEGVELLEAMARLIATQRLTDELRGRLNALLDALASTGKLS